MLLLLTMSFPTQVLPDDSYVLDYMALATDDFYKANNNTQVVTIAVVLQDTHYANPAIMSDCCYAQRPRLTLKVRHPFLPYVELTDSKDPPKPNKYPAPAL